MLFAADMWKWQDYMRISGLFSKGKFVSRLRLESSKRNAQVDFSSISK